MRAKWSAPIRKYWKISEQMMVKYCDLAICDSVNIEKYIRSKRACTWSLFKRVFTERVFLGNKAFKSRAT